MGACSCGSAEPGNAVRASPVDGGMDTRKTLDNLIDGYAAALADAVMKHAPAAASSTWAATIEHLAVARAALYGKRLPEGGEGAEQ